MLVLGVRHACRLYTECRGARCGAIQCFSCCYLVFGRTVPWCCRPNLHLQTPMSHELYTSAELLKLGVNEQLN